ncbi:WD domain, G-beta repeat [Pseudobythopirellula maris]|uniref:WD domain, G-beta repeat n=1 Tax=Pseudobythopirellula maris TaxID=2527991 RepID=A0A5C5ZUH4_9BACT|nr:WD40 repeat domain-containing protein [Pseudobythopirellula maris]TWT90561.1 WD domain, G-beta repeat [Pseudobythopirellula maris]
MPRIETSAPRGARTLLALTLALVAAQASAVQTLRPERTLRLELEDSTAEAPRSAVATAVALSPNGDRILAGADDHRLWEWRTETGELLGRREGHTDWVRGVRFSTDGEWVATVSDDRRLRVYKGDTLSTTDLAPGGLACSAFHPDGQRLIVAGRTQAARLYRLPEGELVETFGCPCGDTRSVAFSPDGSRMAAAGGSGVLRVWDLASGEAVHDFDTGGRRVRAVAFSPDGRLVAAAGDGPLCRLWDVISGESAGEIAIRPAKAFAVAFLADREVAIGGSDNAIRSYDVYSGSPMRRFEGHTGTVAAMTINADRTKMVTAGFDATVRVWPLKRDDVALAPTAAGVGR